MVDALRDSLIPISDVAKKFPLASGKARSYQSVMRWILNGLDGVKLDAKRVGRTWYTTEAALEDFIEQRNRPTAPRKATAKNRRRSAKVKADLRSAGLM